MLTFILTGVGAPGTTGTIACLRKEFGRLKIVGVDMNNAAVGKYLVDSFYKIPEASHYLYRSVILKLYDDVNAKLLIPQTDAELPKISSIAATNTRHFNALISSPESIYDASNKTKLFSVAKELGIPTPETITISSWKELESAAKTLGYPEKAITVKPSSSCGSRGFRVIDNAKETKDSFYNDKPPIGKTTLEELLSLDWDLTERVIVSEYLPGSEYSVDCFRDPRTGFTQCIPRRRDEIRSGISFRTTLEEYMELISYSKMLAAALNLQYCFGFQFKLDSLAKPKLLECNPRVQGSMASTLAGNCNLIGIAAKASLEKKYAIHDVKWSSSMKRVWSGVLLDDSGKKLIKF